MNRSRPLLLAIAVSLSIALAFAVREMVYDLIIVPLSYMLWRLALLMGAVPELVRWAALVAAVGLVLAWQLVPELGTSSNRQRPRPSAVGQVEAVAIWLARARGSSYFKWQLAHRLGRVAQQLEELVDRNRGGAMLDTRVSDYLDAGLNRSFVDFYAPRRLLGRRTETPLDVNPDRVVEYLESQSFVPPGYHADRL